MSDKEKQISEKLTSIEDRITKIEDKITERWVIPVSLTLLTALFATLNFFVERYVSKDDESTKKQSEKFGEFVADSKIKFYSQCKEYLNSTDEQFESYCKLGHSKNVEDGLDSTLINFRKFVRKQQIIDQNLINPLIVYLEFVAESSFSISAQNLDREKSIYMYNESQIYLKEVLTLLDNGINKLLNQ